MLGELAHIAAVVIGIGSDAHVQHSEKESPDVAIGTQDSVHHSHYGTHRHNYLLNGNGVLGTDLQHVHHHNGGYHTHQDEHVEPEVELKVPFAE